MKFFSTRTKGEWYDLEKPTTTGASNAVDEKAAEEQHSAQADILKHSLVEMLQSERLLVLSGLGTSLCVPGAPTMGDLWKFVKEKTAAAFPKVLAQVKYDEAANGEDIELLLSRCQMAESFETTTLIADFITTAETIVVDKVSFLKADTELEAHESFLRRIARRSTRANRAQIFTTNYDLCFEHAASRLHFVAVDGFSHTLPQSFDSEHFRYDFVRRDEGRDSPDYIPNVFQLCKLHGSIDWERDGNEVIKTRKPTKPVLIYPRHTKFESSYEPPFLDLMGRFLSSLRLPNTTLLVSGFGFRDKHLSEPILSAVRSNVGLRLAVIDPAVDTSKWTPFDQLRKLVAGGDPRITLVSAKFPEFSAFLPDLVAATEEERHLERIKGLRI